MDKHVHFIPYRPTLHMLILTAAARARFAVFQGDGAVSLPRRVFMMVGNHLDL